jgi:hypothetical protein
VRRAEPADELRHQIFPSLSRKKVSWSMPA